MKSKVILTPSQAKKIRKAVKEYKALKQMNAVLNNYRGKSFKILKIRQIVKSKLKQK